MSGVRTDTGPFAMIPEWLLYSGVSASAIKLFAVLHRHEGEGGIYPTRKRLAELMGCSLRALDRYREELVTARALTVEHRATASGDFTSNLYHLHFMAPGVETPSARGGATGAGTRAAAETGSDTDGKQTRTPLNESPLAGSSSQPAAVTPPDARARAREDDAPDGAADDAALTLEGFEEYDEKPPPSDQFEGQSDQVRAIADHWTNATGATWTPMMWERMAIWVNRVPDEWITAAIDEAATRGVRRWPYVEAILERWHTAGHRDEPNGGRHDDKHGDEAAGGSSRSGGRPTEAQQQYIDQLLEARRNGEAGGEVVPEVPDPA